MGELASLRDRFFHDRALEALLTFLFPHSGDAIKDGGPALEVIAFCSWAGL